MAGFLHRCASYVMRGRQQAIIIGLLFTMLPLLGWVSNVIIALVTLRKGVKEGAIVLLWIILPVVVIAALANPWIALYNIVGGSLFGFLLAVILRQTQSWQKVLEAGMLLGLLAVLVVHLVRPDINAIWLTQLGHYAVLLKDQLSFSVNTEQLQFFTKFATGFQVAFLWLGVLINLMLARGLQSMLYNPGRLSPELEAVRLSKWDSLVLVLIVIASLQKIAVAQDALPVVLLIFLLAGLSVLHAVIRLRNGFFKGWFLVFYGLLVVFFPYIAALLVLVALADSYLDFRHRVLPKH